MSSRNRSSRLDVSPPSSSPGVPWATIRPWAITTRLSAIDSHFVEEVRGEQHGATAGGEVGQQVAHPAHPLRIEAVGGFVENQHLGIAEQRVGDAQALTHSQRVRPTRLRAARASSPTSFSMLLTRRRSTPISCAEVEQRVDAAAPAVLGGGIEQARRLDVRGWGARQTASRAPMRDRCSAARARTAASELSTCRRRWARGTR